MSHPISRLTLPVMLLLLCALSPVRAQVPDRLAYQGLLTHPGGEPVADGTYRVTFRLYAEDTGEAALWQEVQALQVEEGLFSTLLGQVQALGLPFDRPYYLTVELEGQPESPRMPLTSSPYSLVARDVAPGAVVRSVSGLRDEVDLVAGEGIAIRKEENRLVISARAGAAPEETAGAGEAPVRVRAAEADLITGEDPVGEAEAGAAPVALEAGPTFAPAGAEEALGVTGAGGSNVGLDAAYDKGAVITADGGQVEIVRPKAANNVILRVSKGDLQVQNSVAAQLQLLVSKKGLTQNWHLRTLSTGGDFALYDQTNTKTPFQVARNSANNLVKLSGNTAQIGGSLGVGTSPKAKLHVDGTSWFQGDSTPLAPAAGAGIAVGYAGSYIAGYIFAYDYATSNPLTLLLNHPGGNVGIGTTFAAARLHVDGGGGTGVYSTSTTGSAVFGASSSNSAVFGSSTYGYGVDGRSSSVIGVYGESYSSGSAGVYGKSAFIGVQGESPGSKGDRQAVRGENHGSSTGYAGFFHGNTWVYGTLIKNAGSFRIDHPLDPANKYLNHSFVESPDMMNIYNGNATLDAQGEAVVVLPDYFEALNREFRYQLTAVGAPGPNLYIAEKIAGNRFRIAGGTPGTEVSWQVTGVRQDPYAEKFRIQVEEMKPVQDRGRYLNPEAYGQSMEQAVEILRPVSAPPMSVPAPVPQERP